MSILLALKTNEKIYIAGDQETIKDSGFAMGTSRAWSVGESNSFLIGCVGSIKVINALKNSNLFDHKSDAFDYSFASRFLVSRIRYAIRDESHEEEAYYEDGNGNCEINASIIAGKGNTLYHINEQGTAIEIYDFCAIGDGAATAFNSLLASADIDDPIARIKMALAACVENDVKLEYPITILGSGLSKNKYSKQCLENKEQYILFEKDFIKKTDNLEVL